MSDVILERYFKPPINRDDFENMVRVSTNCMPVYRATWQQSLLASDGERLICHFDAPDCESVRANARNSYPANMTAWRCRHLDSGQVLLANAVVERSFDQPANLEDLQQREDAHRWRLDTYQVTFIRTFFTIDLKRMLCLYRAPDAECVRAAQRQAGMPFDQVWACYHLTPDNCPAHAAPDTEQDESDKR